MIILKALSKNWVYEAFREAWSQKGLSRKLVHLRYRLLWELRPLLKMPGRAPLAVDVEAHSACNYRCVMCQKTDDVYWKSQKEDEMSWETFKTIVDECSELGVVSMKLNWRGEPLLNQRVPDMIFYMKQAGIHEVMMNSNASKLNESLADRLIGSGLDRIIFSCDGVSKETYNKIRKGGDWDDFYSKVKMFRDRCNLFKSIGRKVPIVRINTAVMEENLHEVPKFKEIFEGIADELRFNTVYNPQSSNKYLKERTRQVKRKGCPQIYQRMIVSCEGDGVPCCADYQKKLPLGNVQKRSIATMYRENMGRIRRIHEAGKGRDLNGCDKCDLFALSYKNEKGELSWV